MNTPIDPRTLSPTQHTALYDAARREAAALRGQAIGDAMAALLEAPGRLLAWARALLHASRRPLHRSPCRSA
jgi:hypothetical protein